MAAEVKAKFSGTWETYKSENFEAFVDAMDLPEGFKKMVLTSSPVLTLSVDGETITSVVSFGPKSKSSTFKLGVPFEDDGELPGKYVVTYEGGKMHTNGTPKDPKRKPQVLVRDVVNGELVQTMTVEGVTAKRYSKKTA